MSRIFDIAIIGAGVAGLHLLYAFKKAGILKQKTVIILEMRSENYAIQNLSYWEEGKGLWDDILSMQWSLTEFYRPDGEKIQMSLDSYAYKSLEFSDFLHFVKTETEAQNVVWKNISVTGIKKEKGSYEIASTNENFYASMIFDSRVSADHLESFTASSEPFIWQHFTGWKIKSKKKFFNPECFTMMDYRISDKDTTSFTYVLPYSENEALVEFTYFSPEIVSIERYEAFIQSYIEKYIESNDFEILAKEGGKIPMTTYVDQSTGSGSNIYKIGTAGSWIRPSSGYSFKNSERYAKRIAQNVISGDPILRGVGLRKPHRFYDRILLDILQNQNALGPDIFSQLYGNNSLRRVLRFLDADSSFFAELRLILSLKPLPFLKALVRTINR